MDVVEFAAQRAARLEDADKEIGPFVETALGNFGKPGAWADVVQGASVLWLETYEKESPDTDSAQAMEDFQIMLIESLGKTTPPSQPPTRAEIDRVTRWVGTVTVNDATVAGSAAAGTRIKRWVTMHDPAVREMHRVVDGQVRSTGGKFDVGGHKLRYPGEPVGPPEVWINCRCLAAPGNVRRSMSMTASAEEIELPEAEDEEVTEEVIAEEPLVDDLVDVPWHAVLAPEGVPTGDGRMFAVGSLSTRDLPLPITYQYETAEGHMKAVVVARMDEAWLDEASGQYRARGVFWMNEPMAHKAIDGIAQGFLRGLSVDVDDIEVEQPDVPEDATDEDIMAAMMGEGVTVFSKARIAGASIVHIPAFSEAYIALGPEFEDETELTEDEVAALAACGCIDGVGEEDFVEALMAAAMRPLPETFATGGIVNQRTGRIVGEEGPEAYVPFTIDPDGDRVIPGVGKYWVDETGRARAPRGQKPELEAAYQRELDKAFAPGTKDGPGWITHPRATARIRRYWVRGKGAAKIGWGAPGDFNRCRSQLAKYVRNPDWLAGLCANMHKEALGIWPAQHHSSTVPALLASATPAPMFTLVASGAPVEARYFKNPELTEPVGIVIDGDHIYGYIATWNVCHIGIPGKCEKAPSSPSNYAYYRTGTVQTDEGPIPVGSITMGTGHADDKGDGRVAAAHYDNTGSVIADVATGEDTIGIWFSGRLRDTATEEQRYQLAAAGRLSGDWRWIGRGLELVAALAVNVPGFPIPRPALVASAGEVVTVTGFGIVEPDESSLVASALDAEMIAAISRTAVEEYIDQTEKRKVRDERLAALAPFRKQAREAAIMRLRGKIGE